MYQKKPELKKDISIEKKVLKEKHQSSGFTKINLLNLLKNKFYNLIIVILQQK